MEVPNQPHLIDGYDDIYLMPVLCTANAAAPAARAQKLLREGLELKKAFKYKEARYASTPTLLMKF
jgi:hypothetical protein